MRARLFARFGPDAGRELEFGRQATIGRDEENDLVLSSPEVSKRHARVVFDDEAGAYCVEDLDSLNGTRLDSVRVRGRARLSAVHVLGLGEAVELFFVELDRSTEEPEEPEAPAAPADEGTRIDALAPTLPVSLQAGADDGGTRVDAEVPTLPVGLRPKARPERAAGSSTEVEEAPATLPGPLSESPPAAERAVAPADAAVDSAFVLEVVGRAAGRFRLREGENLIGRASYAVVRLKARELSRRHATLRIEGERAWLRDEGSRNHTYVDGEKIAGEVEIAAAAELRFGKIEARLERAAEEGDGGDG